MTAIRSQARDIVLPMESRINAEILLVEDQRSLAKSLAKALHDRWGCKVLIATSMEQVKQIIAQKERRFFIAISDLVLPDAPNGEVIDVLTAAHFPTIAMSGAFDQKQHDQIMRKGVIDFVQKKSVDSYEYLVRLTGRLYRNRRCKVLVVDDDPMICKILRVALSRQFLEVIVAGSLDEVQKQLGQHPEIRVVLVDYNLADNQDGVELVAALRKQHSMDDLAIIGISGRDDSMLASQFLKVGANDFLAKPFTNDEIVCRISNNLDLLEKIAAIRHIAYHDHLTGLLNRRAFFERGAMIHEKAMREGAPLTLAMLDIDYFKKVNDTYGHDAGDAVLRHFARLLIKHFDKALVGRLGGEEFALLAKGDSEEIRQHCEAFREVVEKTPTHFMEKAIAVTVSIGLTPKLGETLDETIKRADVNLYQAKNGARNCVVAS